MKIPRGGVQENKKLLILCTEGRTLLVSQTNQKVNWKGNKDGFLLDFGSFVEKQVGMTNYNRYITSEFIEFDGKEILMVQVEKSLDPVFIKVNGKKIMFIRLNNKTEPIDDPEEINKYIEDNWK